MIKSNILLALATIMMVASANYEQSSSSNSKVLATETEELYGDLLEIMDSNDAIQGDYARISGSSGMSGLNRHSNEMLGSMSSQNSYGTGSVQSNIHQSSRAGGSSVMSGMNHQPNHMFGSMSSQGSYSTGNTQRSIQQRRMSMPRTSQFKSASSGSQSNPTIRYLEPEFTEADNSNTMFIQNHGSAESNGMTNSGSVSNYGMQDFGSASSNGMLSSGSASNYGMQNHGSAGSNGFQNSGSASNYGMQNHGSAGSNGMLSSGSSSNYGMQNHGSAGSNGMQNSGSASNYGMHNHGSAASDGMQNSGIASNYGMQHQESTSNGMLGMSYQSAGYY